MILMMASPINPVSAVARTTNPANFLKAAMFWKYVTRHRLQSTQLLLTSCLRVDLC